jgi:hypothetical protein
MTTNVLDRRNQRVTSDSRWSIRKDDEVFFIDDSKLEKIVDLAATAMVCAGNAALIVEWRKWFKSLMTGPMPPTWIELPNGSDTIYVTIIRKEGFETLFTRGEYDACEEDAKFAGSGGKFALPCYVENRCSTRCIQTASQFDECTGGDVKFVDFDDALSNLSYQDTTVDDVIADLRTRGKVMNIRTRKEAALADLPDGYFDSAVGASALALSAPIGHAAQPWTEEEKNELAKAMEVVRQLEAAANA